VLVSDAGCGFVPGEMKSGAKGDGFGLFSIRERIIPLGGAFKIDSPLGGGSRFTLTCQQRPLLPQESYVFRTPRAGMITRV
jgi:signal transduction histidine kinase